MIVFFATLFALVALNIFCTAVFLKLGLHWAKAEGRDFRTALVATAIASFVGYAAVAAMNYFGLAGDSIAEALIQFLIVMLAFVVTVQCFFGTSIFASLKALVPPTVLTPVVCLPLVYLIIIPFVAESFVVPTNSMAPTVAGVHVEGTCPDCGQVETIGIPQQKSVAHCICQNFHTRLEPNFRGKQLPGDRVFVVKFLRPKRWDIAAFKVPSDPKVSYIKRVVGLPGETIHIENGSVFVDGVQLTPPEHLENLTYSTSLGTYEALNGSKENPAVLGSDEYFVLGDNTERAMDSRFWKDGALGHNAYAVPESYIFGVATVIYWPPKRWKSLK